MDLIKWGWTERDRSDQEFSRLFHRISALMRTKSHEIKNFIYVLIDVYFIDDNNNLYFFGNDDVYSVDLNDSFNYNYTDIDLCWDDYKKIKFICKLTLENIIEHELVSKEFRRDKKISDLLDN